MWNNKLEKILQQKLVIHFFASNKKLAIHAKNQQKVNIRLPVQPVHILAMVRVIRENY